MAIDAQTIGLLAGFLTTVAFLPQIIKSHQTKSTGDISWGWLGVLFVGVVLWFIYGLMDGSLPVAAANGISGVLLVVLIFLKLKYG